MGKGLGIFLGIIALLAIVVGSGYNGLQTGDEEIKASWSEVLNQFQRRADLVPNLVRTVQGYAAHEKNVLEEVTAARAKVGSLNVSTDGPGSEENLAKFQAAQKELSTGLGRLLAVAENYPQLKADQGFRDLQAQLEGTENRIAVARGRYIDAVKSYNLTVRKFPSNLTAMFFGYTTKPNFTVDNEKELAKPPTVDFGK